MKSCLLVAKTVVCTALSVFATATQGIVSPDGKVCVEFSLVEGQPKIAVAYETKNLAVIDLGLVLEEPYQGGFEIERSETGGADSVWKPVWGERAEIRDAHRDCSIVLRERGPKARRLRVEMRAYPEGFAFRYVLLGEGREKVVDESTRVVFAPGTVAWPIRNTEDTYPAEPIDAANLLSASGKQHFKNYMLPLPVRRPDGVCASLFEAYVRHYPRAKGEVVGGGTKIHLLGGREGRPCGTTVNLPFEGPWRAIQVGKDAAALVEHSTLVLNLNPPCAIKDTSYIQPGLCLSDLSNCAMNNCDSSRRRSASARTAFATSRSTGAGTGRNGRGARKTSRRMRRTCRTRTRSSPAGAATSSRPSTPSGSALQRTRPGRIHGARHHWQFLASSSFLVYRKSIRFATAIVHQNTVFPSPKWKRCARSSTPAVNPGKTFGLS